MGIIYLFKPIDNHSINILTLFVYLYIMYICRWIFVGSCKINKCSWNNWSTWSVTCGPTTRQRNLQKYDDLKYLYNCTQAQQLYGCTETKESERQTASLAPCKSFYSVLRLVFLYVKIIGYHWNVIFILGTKECSFVECSNNEWSSWSSSCGLMTRSRTVKVVQKKEQRVTCKGLATSCSAQSTQVERHSVTCKFLAL